MARKLSPAAQNLVALIAIVGLTVIAEHAPAAPPFQRPTTPTAAKASIAIKPAAPPRTTTAQGPRSTRPVATAYRNPFSSDSTSSSEDSVLLPGPRSRWRTAQAPPNEHVSVHSKSPIIAPAIITPTKPTTPPPISFNQQTPAQSPLRLIEPKPTVSTPQLINPAPATRTTNPVPLRVTSVETPSAPPSALAPPTPLTQTTPPRTTMSVKSAILTADASEHAEFDWNTPPALKSQTNNNVASANRAIKRPSDETSALELPDPTSFTPQPNEPVWLESGVPQKRPSSLVDQAAYEEPLQGEPPQIQPSQSEPLRAPTIADLPSEASTEPSGDEEPLIISDQPDSPDGWLAQAKEAVHTAHTIDDLSAAIDLCQRVVTASPTPEIGTSARRLSAWAHNRRGELLIDAGQTEDALKEFQTAVANDPENSLAIHNRAVTLAQQSDFDAALVDFNRVIELNPGLAIAYRNRAELLAAQGKMDEAVADYTRAIETVSDDPEMYQARSHALQQLGRFDQALADLDHSIRLAPNIAQSYTQRGNLLADRGEVARALDDFKQSLAIDPKLAETHRGLAWVKATCPDDRYRDAYEALGAAQTAIKLSSPDDYLALDALAAAHANAGEFNKAIETQKQAINNAPPDATEPMQARLNLYEQHQPYRARR